ncbi:hypothetical protein [Rhodoferax antarcticus]|uniref:hypothetical protein n=1 Tax=Rhodoferax antarcticus TaxID=81479 RepID=UPI0011151B65|nr:hypothetical protein [Rhodoferax antarcticus]
MRGKTTFKTDTLKVKIYRGQSIDEVAPRVAESYGATVDSCVPVDPVIALLRALRETIGFLEAWKCHLSDSGSDRAAETVSGVMIHVRSVYNSIAPSAAAPEN